MVKMLLIGLTYWAYWPPFLIFGLTLFRFKLKPLIPHIAYTTMAMSCLAIFLQTTKLIYFISIFLFVGLLLCLYFIYRIALVHCLVMLVVTYSIIILLEWSMNALFPSTIITMVTEENMVRFFRNGLAFSAVPLIFTVILRKTRIGFSFIKRSKFKHVSYQQSAVLNPILILSFIAMFVLSLGFFFYPETLVLISALLLLIVGVLLRISYHWEMAD